MDKSFKGRGYIVCLKARCWSVESLGDRSHRSSRCHRGWHFVIYRRSASFGIRGGSLTVCLVVGFLEVSGLILISATELTHPSQVQYMPLGSAVVKLASSHLSFQMRAAAVLVRRKSLNIMPRRI